MKEKKKNTKILLPILLVALLIAIVGGVTYAFFNYTRTGLANTFSVGRISFNTRQTETINLSNLFPIDVTNGIPNDDTKVGTFELEITGDTDYVGGIEYLVSTANTQIYTGTGKFVPISLDVTLEGLGTSTDSYFTARNAKNATIYKRLSGNSVVGDQQLLVGYIKPNTTSGTIEGINGKITIKAYLDADIIAISDTYNDNGIVTDNLGTTSEWVDGRTVFTTEEWNALQNSGISFQVKVEANEDIWVNEPIYDTLRKNAVMDNIRSSNVSAETGIDFSKISGDTDNDGVIDNGEGLYVRAGTENDAYPIVYYRGNVDNNVYFAGKCWQIIRTTDTGGTKMIYNGENTGTEEVPACENTTGASRQITLNVDGTDKNTFQFSGADLYDSLAYSGYMYNSPVYSVINGDYETGSKFGNGVIWDGTNYTITDISNTRDGNHHYTCGTANTTTCSSIRYYYFYSISNPVGYMYFNLTNGKTIEDVVRESLENGTTESNAKVIVDDWYEENIHNTPFVSMIEDTIYCNDRSIYELGPLNPNGGSFVDNVYFSGVYRNGEIFNPSTKCIRTQDSFTKESANGNGLLDYPVGLITLDEMSMAGGKLGDQSANNANYYLTTGKNYWSMSPYMFISYGSAYEFRVFSTGNLTSTKTHSSTGIRPVLSLKLGTSITDGDGTGASPYIVK